MRLGQWVGNQGDVHGYGTMMFHLPERNATVAVAVNRYDAGQDLPEGATLIFMGIVNEFYPGSWPDASGHDQTDHLPALPSPDELDKQLQQALDPSVPAQDKTLKIADDARDPELITALANAFQKAGQRLHVEKVTDLGRGHAVATLTLTLQDGHRRPSTMSLVPRSGSWRISTGWACTIAVLNGIVSPACG
jgi:D-alanyl-D-alanine carboxypeptidase